MMMVVNTFQVRILISIDSKNYNNSNDNNGTERRGGAGVGVECRVE